MATIGGRNKYEVTLFTLQKIYIFENAFFGPVSRNELSVRGNELFKICTG